MAKITKDDLAYLLVGRGGKFKITFEKPTAVTLDLEQERWTPNQGTTEPRWFGIVEGSNNEGRINPAAHSEVATTVAVYMRNQADGHHLMLMAALFHHLQHSLIRREGADDM